MTITLIKSRLTPLESIDPQNVKVPIRRSARISQALDRYGFYVDVEEYELGDLDEPPNYKAALSYPESNKWLEAMNTKMQSMKDNQMDVKTAFLNGHLNEDVYMVQPKGLVDPKHPNRTGYVFVLNDGAVDWKSAKRSTTAMSSTPIEMLCDNEPAIKIANDSRILRGDNYFQRKYHYIREVILKCEIILKKVHTYDNISNPFTKPMSLNKHFEHAMAIGIVPASSIMDMTNLKPWKAELFTRFAYSCISRSIDDVAMLFINEIWLRVQQMMKGSDIGIQEKKAKLFNEWERFTSNEGESIESYYHCFLKLMNDLKTNKYFPEKIA
nr:hypothetical protein [Tanacetum cinerariifolium]